MLNTIYRLIICSLCILGCGLSLFLEVNLRHEYSTDGNLTDYVFNLVTNYHFPESDSCPETCIGIIKGSMVHSKSPSQHMADLEMIESMDEFNYLFENRDVEFVRFDGASDEN